ncbi:MAG TPA: DinB family protein [Gemmatimonadaceae bacterium]|nr:DinB family protein [Gemmatimonadaceae bacterium]
MEKQQNWREIVASSLGWEQAHASLESAVENLAPKLRGQRPKGEPHSPWELLDHIRITQRDLLDFCQNENYVEKLEWPHDYWPSSPAPPSEEAWQKSIDECRRDSEALARFTTDTEIDLTSKIPRGTGQTYLRTVLLAVDHTAYHVGQIVLVRRLLDAWPAK